MPITFGTKFRKWLDEAVPFFGQGTNETYRRFSDLLDGIQKTVVADAAATSTQQAKVAMIAGVNTAGGVFNWVAPANVIILRTLIDVTTPATGAATLDIGTTTVSAVTAATNIFSAQDVHTAGGVFDSDLKSLKLAAGKWVTGSVHAGGDSTGMVGNVYIFYCNQ